MKQKITAEEKGVMTVESVKNSAKKQRQSAWIVYLVIFSASFIALLLGILVFPTYMWAGIFIFAVAGAFSSKQTVARLQHIKMIEKEKLSRLLNEDQKSYTRRPRDE